ncbi:MAG: DUF4290 domain-containing protein [Tidjanibacter sp.]|nr:DUF4290 domain-containing protein [Tidjanibacter sp.]
MKTNYNIERQKLHLPEYGRHIQDMVEELMRIENREERNLRAKALVAIMANIQHSSSETPDFERKLWDHLFIMSDFQLDVDSPYPKPSATTIMPPPARMSYPTGGIAMKHYGRNVRNVIRSLRNIRTHETVDAVVHNLARYMRTKSYEYNQEHPDNAVIIRDIRRMADFDISVDEEAITRIKSDYRLNHSGYQKKSAYKKNGGKNQKNGRRMGYNK